MDTSRKKNAGQRRNAAKKDDPWQQHSLLRMQEALSLGMRRYQDGSSKWCSSDTGVQLQALRSIADVAETLASNTSLPPCFKDVVKALEALLQVKNEQVTSKAAAICVTLVTACGSTRPTTLTSLVTPLARMLSSSTLSASAAVSLRVLLENRNSVQQEGVLAAIKEAKSLEKVAKMIEERCGGDMEVLASYMELLAVVLEISPSQRYVVAGSSAPLRRIFLEYACNARDDLSAASLRALSSSIVCFDVARQVAEEKSLLSAVFTTCLASSRSRIIKMNAFHLLYCLAKFSMYLSGCECDVGTAASSCIQRFGADGKWSLEDEQLLLVAAHATSAMLSVTGRVRLQLLSGGIVASFRALLLCPRSNNKKSNRDLRILIYDSIGWIACLCNKQEEAVLFPGDGNFKELIDHICATFFGAVIRRGRKCDLSENEILEEKVSSQKTPHLCRAAARLVSSPSVQCSSCMIDALEHELQSCPGPCLESLVDSLHLRYIGVDGKSETQARLYALSTALYAPALRQELDISCVLQVLLNLVKEEMEAGTLGLGLTPARCFRVLKPCCSQRINNWSGNNEVLFAAVFALGVLLLHSSTELKSATENEPTVALLRILAEDGSLPDGVRWWALFGLSCCGYYGMPCTIGKLLSKMKDDPTLKDLVFVFPDGNSLMVHATVLAGRCPKLLPEKKGSEETRTVRISSRTTYRAVKSIMEIVYTGFVQLQPEELPDVKMLAKRCHLDSLVMLLSRKTPPWGRCIDNGSLEPALRDSGHQYCDLQISCGSDCFHVHKAILTGCNYYAALFRSGMRESFQNVLKAPARVEVMSRFIHYLYTGELEGSTSGCSWPSLKEEEQLDFLEQMIELADLSDYLLEDDLRQQCVEFIVNQKASLAVYPGVMKHAYLKNQWEVVVHAAEVMAGDYPLLRETGALDCLEDELVDMVRASYVKLSLQNQ